MLVFIVRMEDNSIPPEKSLYGQAQEKYFG